MALRQAVRVPGPGLRMSAATPVRPARFVLTRAEPPSGAKVTREFREDTGEVSTPGASQTTRREADGLYVNADAPRPVPRKDNMSKEMKARLRKEYTGLGGAENSAAAVEDEDDFMLPMPPRMAVIAAASVETVEAPAAPAAAPVAAAAAPAAEPATPAAAAAAAPAGDFTARPAGATVTDAQASTSAPEVLPKAHSSKFVVDENENLKSTPEMRAWTGVSIAMMGATFAEAVNKVNGFDDVVSLGAAVFMAYVMADLGTGVYHWGVDNYGDGNTPVFGRQIAAFQGHHQRPWTITQREFANNLHQVFQPAAYPAAGLLAICPSMSVGWNAWASSFLFLVCMSQQFHAWSHMKKSELHPVVVALQDANVLISRKAHGAHHRAPFEGNYCIVSGWWNDILDRSNFFRKAEKFIFHYTGIEPRCWEMPTEDWKELERPGASTSA